MILTAGRPRGAHAAVFRIVFAVALAASLALGLSACRKKETPLSGVLIPPAQPGDCLFLSEAPAFVPDDVDAELSSMRVVRLYVAAATMSRSGVLAPLPPPPSPLKRPIVLTILGEEGAAASVAGGGAAMGESWARGLTKILSETKGWGRVEGVHFHLWPAPEQAKELAVALSAVRQALGVPVSVTLPPSPKSEVWKPLAGAVDEALVFAFGRRPELGGLVVSEMPEEAATSFPVPFRLLVAFGGYGRAGDGSSFTGRELPDGMIDQLSEDRALDFDFGQVFSSEPGTVYTFKPRQNVKSSLLAADGGWARFQILTFAEGVRFLASAGRWAAPRLRGRVFLLGGVPTDGHLLGYAAVRALLTGAPVEPRLTVAAVSGDSGRGFTEISVRATNVGPAPSDLTHYNNWVQLRVEGGTVAAVKPGGFDRYDQLTSEAEGFKATTPNRAVVCRLYENLFAPGEVNLSGPIRLVGTRPRVFLSWRLATPDGKTVSGPEIEAMPVPPSAPASAAPAPRLRSRRR